MFPAAAAIAAGASILGGVMGSSSAASQNREQREWEEYMANTQYQRGVADMKKAGLNPAMIYAKGGGQAGVGGGPRMEEGRGRSEGVRQAGLLAVQANNIQAQTEQAHSAAQLAKAQAELVSLEKNIKEADFAGESFMPGFKVPSSVVPGGVEVLPDLDPSRRGKMVFAQRVIDVMKGRAQIKDLETSAAGRIAARDLTEAQESMTRLGIPKEQAMAALYRQYGDKLAKTGGIREVLSVLKLIVDMMR